MNKKNLVILVSIIVLIAVAFFIYNSRDVSSFSVSSVLIKLAVPIGGESINKISIDNGNKEQNIDLDLINLEGIVSVDESNFILAPGESKKVELTFKDSFNEVKTYYGKLRVRSNNHVEEVPIIFSIIREDSDIVVVSKTISQSKLYPGGEIGFEVKLFDLSNRVGKSIALHYTVSDFEGKVFITEEETVVFKDSLTFTKTFSLPNEIAYGHYIFIVNSEIKEDKNTASSFFEIERRNKGLYPDVFSVLVVVVLGFVVAIVVLFLYFVRSQNKLLLELKRQHQEELRHNVAIIREDEKRARKIKDPRKRRKRVKHLKKIKKRVVRKIKKKQREQVKKLKSLKRKKLTHSMHDNLARWKREGYEFPELKKEIKLSNKRLNNQVSEWKQQGYDTKVLRK